MGFKSKVVPQNYQLLAIVDNLKLYQERWKLKIQNDWNLNWNWAELTSCEGSLWRGMGGGVSSISTNQPELIFGATVATGGRVNFFWAA